MNHPMIKDQIINGVDADELPWGIGEYGRNIQNPIPVNGALGELIYLSSLITDDSNMRLLFHRLGSSDTIDIYETVTIDGNKWDLLFVSMYHPRKSTKTPTGYLIKDMRSQPLIYGTNKRVETFPNGLQSFISETTKEMIGVPLPPPEVRQAEESIKFSRPKEHVKLVEEALEHVAGFLT